MRQQSNYQSANLKHSRSPHRSKLNPVQSGRQAKPAAAYRQRVLRTNSPRDVFNATEVWYEPAGSGELTIKVQPPGTGYIHPVSVDEVRARLAELPAHLTQELEVVQFSRMTRKRRAFPCYGMQWGQTVYLYPIEETLVEAYVRPPKPAQEIEARMFGGTWSKAGKLWHLTWTPETIKDFYLNNVLIHEVGHINDGRNTSYQDREDYANWFAIEYGYRASRGRIG